MGANTKIEWATHTLNLWEGCTKVSEGCAHCYAAERDARFHAGAHWGPGAPRRVTAVATWLQADKWNREAIHSGIRPRIFVNSLSDILDPEVPVDVRAAGFATIERNKACDFLLVTKRPELFPKLIREVREYLMAHYHAAGGETSRKIVQTNPNFAPFRDVLEKSRAEVAEFVRQHVGVMEMVCAWTSSDFTTARDTAPENVWFGTTVENQARADERIPHLLAIPARVRFLSVEPMLGPIEFSDVTRRSDAVKQLGKKALSGIHWVICGGESGPKARPMHPDWARSVRDQCTAVGVPFFFKQWGSHAPGFDEERYTHDGEEKKHHVWLTRDGKQSGLCWIVDEEGTWSNWTGEAPTVADGECREDVAVMHPCKKEEAGRLLDGVEHNALPEVRR